LAPNAHASFSASSSARLLACPGSYALALAADDGKRRSSIFAAEGTLAHSMSEACLHSNVDAVSFVGDKRTADGFEFTVDEDMAEGVQTYVDYVRGLQVMGYEVRLEVRVNPAGLWDGLAPLNTDLFGTSDVVAYNPTTKDLRIVDLKFGRGIAVEVENNSQLLYYAAGAMAAAGANAKSVTATIIQPRAHHPKGPIRSHTYTGEEVRKWARTTLYNGVDRALSDNGKTLCAGSHCRFCPVAASCKTLADLSFETARAAYLAAPADNLPASAPTHAGLPQITLSPEALGDLLNKIEIIGPWIDAVKAMAKERLETTGAGVEGWKLVPTRPARKWADTDEDAQTAALQADLARAGEDPSKIVTTKLRTPAQVEKSLGKAAYAAHVAPHVVKLSGGVTLAPELDPRSAEARRSAQEAFGLIGGASTTQPQP
jgi:hypothetical protein